MPFDIDDRTPRSALKNGLLVGLGFVLGSATILAVFRGAALFQSEVYYSEARVMSGTVATQNLTAEGTGSGYTYDGYSHGIFTSSGGQPNYPLCTIPYPIDEVSRSSSGVIVTAAFLVGGVTPSLVVGASTVTCAFASTGAVISASVTATGGNTIAGLALVAFGTGSIHSGVTSTGTLIWTKQQVFHCSTALANLATASGATGRCGVKWYETYGTE